MYAKQLAHTYIEEDNFTDINYARLKRGLGQTREALEICLLNRVKFTGENKNALKSDFMKTVELINLLLGEEYSKLYFPISETDYDSMFHPNEVVRILMKRSVESVTTYPEHLYSPEKKIALLALKKYISNQDFSLFEFNDIPGKKDGDSAEYLRGIFTKTKASFAELIIQERREGD